MSTLEERVTMIVGDAYPFTVTIVNEYGSAPSVSSPTCAIYIKGNSTDLTATNLSGSASASGNVVTTPTVTGLKGGEEYVLTITATVDGRTDVYQVFIKSIYAYGGE